MTHFHPKQVAEVFLSEKDKALPDVSDYFGNSVSKFIDFIKLVGVPINARLYSNSKKKPGIRA